MGVGRNRIGEVFMGVHGNSLSEKQTWQHGSRWVQSPTSPWRFFLLRNHRTKCWVCRQSIAMMTAEGIIILGRTSSFKYQRKCTNV